MARAPVSLKNPPLGPFVGDGGKRSPLGQGVAIMDFTSLCCCRMMVVS